LEIRAIKKGQLLIERAGKEIIEKSEAKNNKVVKTVEEMKKTRV